MLAEDGQVTKVEWVTRRLCAYGDSGDYARFLWDRFAQGATVISVAGPPAGTPVGQGSNPSFFPFFFKGNQKYSSHVIVIIIVVVVVLFVVVIVIIITIVIIVLLLLSLLLVLLLLLL